jgi:hypothetical protein
MMKLVGIAVVFTAACTDSPPTPRIIILTGPTLHLSETGRGSTAVEALPGSQAESVELDSSACSCTTEACVTDWIEANIGPCVCADIACSDGTRLGACVACTP